MKKFAHWFLVISLFYLPISGAQYNTAYQNTIPPTPPPPPNNIEAAGQYYDGSISGLRDYMDEELKISKSKRDRKLYRVLNSQLEKLESAKTWSIVSMVVGVGAGLGLILASAGKDCYVRGDVLQGEDPNCASSRDGMMYAGIGVSAVGLGAFYLIKPGRKDIMKFINKHNRLNKSKPLKWQLGYNPNGGIGILAKYEF